MQTAGPTTKAGLQPPVTKAAVAPSSRVNNAMVLVFVAIPLAFLENQILGFQLSGWAWILLLTMVAPLVLVEPLHGRAIRHLLPYLLFLLYATATLAWVEIVGEGVATLAQLLVPALAYLTAWRAQATSEFRRKLKKASILGLGIAGVLALIYLMGGNDPSFLSPSIRGMSISLVVLFVVATMDSRTARHTVLVGAIAIAISISLGSRITSAVLLVLLLCSATLGGHHGRRIILAAACILLLLALSETDSFRQRFFFDERGSLVDVLTLSNRVNTAGRRELWPRLIKECSATSVTGRGVGASYGLSRELSGGTLDHPHNDYLRTYCDEGWLGSVPFWAFFFLALLRSWWGAFFGPDARLHAAAGQLALALLIIAITDNPIVYTAHFMAPLAVILGLSDRALYQNRFGIQPSPVAEHHRIPTPGRRSR
jgi:O-antigen ligase